MSRINLFEFEDFSCTPKIVRNATTDFLRTSIAVTNIYSCIFEDIVTTLEKTNTNKIIDVCSGGGGPQSQLIKYIMKNPKINKSFESITLTDLYPNINAFSYMQSLNTKIVTINYSIDATNIPNELKGMRTLFTSFHHLDPNVAKKVLRNCIDSGNPIGIFEYTERSALCLLKFILLGPPIILILMLFSKPFSFKKILITPIATITTWWDGIASCLRTYSVKELNQLINEVDTNKIYEWKTGKKFSLRNLSYVSYLIGYKK